MKQWTGACAILLLLVAFAVPAAWAQPAPTSASYSEATNSFTIEFSNSVRTTNADFIVPGILVDDDNGGPLPDFELRGGRVTNTSDTGTEVTFEAIFGNVIGHYTYDDNGSDVPRDVWGNDYADVIEIEEELRHGSGQMRLYLPAGSAVSPNGNLSPAAWVPLTYTEQSDEARPELVSASYDAASNVLSLTFDETMQFDQLPEDIALESPNGDWLGPGNGVLDAAIGEDRNDNGVLDMEQNVVVANIVIAGASGQTTLVSADDLTNQDSSTLELKLSPADRAAVEELDTSEMSISFGNYTFVDVDYNPAVPVSGFPVNFTADPDPLQPVSASYDMGENLLTIQFDEPLESNVRAYAVIPKVEVLRVEADSTYRYALEAGTPGLTNSDSAWTIEPGVSTAQAIESLIDADPDGDFQIHVRSAAVRSEEGNGNLAGTVNLEIVAESDRNKGPEVVYDEEPYYNAVTNQLFILFDVRLEGDVELDKFYFVDSDTSYALTGGEVDRESGNKAIVVSLNADDQHMVENVMNSSELSLLIEPYAVFQQRKLNGNRMIEIDPLPYQADPNPPLVNYFFYDEQNQRFVVGSNVTIDAGDVDFTAATVNGQAVAGGGEYVQASPYRVYYSGSELDLPLDDRTDLVLDLQPGFLTSGDGVESVAQTELHDGDVTTNDLTEATLTMGYGREFFIRSYEAFPTVPRTVAASLRRVSDGALWYVANDQWAPYQPYETREGKDGPHPVVTALRPAELDSAVTFFEESSWKDPSRGAREVILDVMAGDQADRVPDRVNILFADVYDEFGLGRNDSKSSFWKHGYFLPSDLPGNSDQYSNNADLVVVDSYPQSFAAGDEAYTWNSSNEEWTTTDMTPLNTSGLGAISNVYTQWVAYKVDRFEDRWVREGLAYLSEFLTYQNPAFYGGGVATGLSGDNSLLFIGSDFKVRTDYKHVFMYYLYLWEKYGGNDFIRAVATSARTGMNGVSAALDRRNDQLEAWQRDMTVEDIYLDFATANLIDTTYSDSDHNRWMFENLNTQGAIRGKSLKWKPAAGKDRPPYEESVPEWGFTYYFTGYGPFDPNPLLDPTEDDLIITAEEDAPHLDFRKANMKATTVSSNMSSQPIMMQDVEINEENRRDAVPMSPDGASGAWVFGPTSDPNATFPTWTLIASGGGDFILHHDATAADFARLFVAQNKVITNSIDLYVISELPLYRADGVAAPTVYASTDEAGTDTVAVYDDPGNFVQTSIENAAGRFEQYVAHVNVTIDQPVYWHLAGQFSNGVPVEGGDPSYVTFATFPGGEAGQFALEDGARFITSSHAFDGPTKLLIVRSPHTADFGSGSYVSLDDDRTPVSDVYSIGNSRQQLEDPMRITLPYEVDAAAGEDVGLYLMRNGRWDYVGGIADDVAGRISARVGQLGTYRVMAGAHGDVPADLVVPTEFALGANYPNPFNPSTTFQVTLPQSSELRLAVYDVLGREVAEIFNGRRGYGVHTFHFDGRGQAGTPLASGVYFLRMESEGFVGGTKMVLVK